VTAGTVRPAPVDAALLRAVFRRQAATVAVLTLPGDPPAGLTVTSLTSVSLVPPLVSVCVGTASSVWPTLLGATHLGVHLLAENQHDLAVLFASSGADRFGRCRTWRPGPMRVPVLDGVVGWLVCRRVGLVPAGDHAVVVAEPVHGWCEASGRPLLYHDGAYSRLAPPG
jgi:flavin reductase (DIM6/NTAB) family NADH-FMN oxidoreductase RutF